eukprot:TRINITY_DN2442_c0_g1_i3.p2 TRINITY_DN2442_c0_g1~~TRINITY_DN2442_c0_g1_i3.p2  ORF type:complete len:406 (-),score=164.60 TRINITY_DN2442_c0_g1_i3:1646-2827(-)
MAESSAAQAGAAATKAATSHAEAEANKAQAEAGSGEKAEEGPVVAVERIRRVLEGTTAGALVASKMLLVAVPDDATVEFALSVLNQFRITSLPVSAPEGRYLAAGGVDATTADHHQFIGIVSIADIALHIAQAANAAEQEKYMSAKIASLIGSTNESRSLWVTPPDKSLYYAMEPFGKHVHRTLVPRTTDEGKNFTLLTQSDVLRFLVEHKEELAPVFGRTLSQVLGATEEQLRQEKSAHVVAVRSSDTALEALRTLQGAGVTAGPIVDEAGKLVGTLSFSDLRAMDCATLLKLRLNVVEFVAELKEPDHFATLSSVSCALSDSLLECAQQMLEKRVHRMWICDGDNVVIGVLSITDVLKVFGPGSALMKRKHQDMAGEAAPQSDGKRQKSSQ